MFYTFLNNHEAFEDTNNIFLDNFKEKNISLLPKLTHCALCPIKNSF